MDRLKRDYLRPDFTGGFGRLLSKSGRDASANSPLCTSIKMAAAPLALSNFMPPQNLFYRRLNRQIERHLQGLSRLHRIAQPSSNVFSIPATPTTSLHAPFSAETCPSGTRSKMTIGIKAFRADQSVTPDRRYHGLPVFARGYFPFIQRNFRFPVKSSSKSDLASYRQIPLKALRLCLLDQLNARFQHKANGYPYLWQGCAPAVHNIRALCDDRRTGAL